MPSVDYPDGLEAIASASLPSPWLYTGALENHPDLVDRIAATRPLWGNPGPVLRAVRDPLAVAEALGRAGLPCPSVRPSSSPPPRDGRWLAKPLASAGGREIRVFEGPLGGPGDCPLAPGAWYYQERIEGTSLSATFVAGRSGAVLLGLTEQWVGRPGAEFGYQGSLGPWPLSGPGRSGVLAIGRALADAFGLVGLFGVDLLLRDGVPWPVEVNPRYTASVEVLELALGRPFLDDHRRACDPDAPPRPTAPGQSEPRRFVGKATLFAEAPCRFAIDHRAEADRGDPFAIPEVADVPAPGTLFEPGEPVLTVLADGPSLEVCRTRLARRLAGWRRRLGPTTL